MTDEFKKSFSFLFIVFIFPLIIIIFSSVIYYFLFMANKEAPLEYVGVERINTPILSPRCHFEFEMNVPSDMRSDLRLDETTLRLISDEEVINIKNQYTLYNEGYLFRGGKYSFVVHMELKNPIFDSCSNYTPIFFEITFWDKHNKGVNITWEK